jgi:hypothetical protein
MANREANIQLAIADLQSRVYPSIRAAAKAYNIPQTTLTARVNGTASRRDISHQHQQRLTPLQEEFLVEWILEEDARGYAPSHARAREMAERVLRSNGDTKPLGKRWVSSFIHRNPRVASIIGRRIEASRIHSCTQPEIQAFFDRLERAIREHNVQTNNIWNMDEHGLGLGICTNTRVLGDASKKRTYVTAPQDREWVSIIETISAGGRKTRPLVIFKGATLQSTWFEDRTPDWVYTTSDNGWTSNRIAIGWLQEIFLPESDVNDQPRILIIDGHGSHITTEFMWICKQNSVKLIYLPPHSSHVLQPLDLSCYSPVKSRYRSQIAALATLDDSAPVKKQRFIHCYNLTRAESLTDRVIRSGWNAAGISPWNPSKALNSSQVARPIQRPVTPPRPTQVSNPNMTPVFKTPQSSQQLQQLTQRVQKRSKIQRDIRTILQKAGRAIERANFTQAMQQATIQRQQHQIESLTPVKPRKKVTIDPNTRFASIESIRAAQEESKRVAKERAQKQPLWDAKKAANEAAATALSNMCFEWQL